MQRVEGDGRSEVAFDLERQDTVCPQYIDTNAKRRGQVGNFSKESLEVLNEVFPNENLSIAAFVDASGALEKSWCEVQRLHAIELQILTNNVIEEADGIIDILQKTQDDALAAVSKTLKTIRKAASKIIGELENLCDKIAKNKKAIAKIQQEIGEVKSKIKSISGDIEVITAQITVIKAQVKAAQQTFNKAKQQVDEYKKKVDDDQNKVDQLQKEVDKSKQNVGHLKQKLATDDSKLDDTNGKISNIEQQLKNPDLPPAKKMQLESQLSSLKQQQAQQQKQVDDDKIALGQAKQQLSSQVQTLDVAQKVLSVSEQGLTHANAILEQAKNKFTEECNNLTKALGELSAKKDELKKMNNSLMKLDNDLVDAQNKLKLQSKEQAVLIKKLVKLREEFQVVMETISIVLNEAILRLGGLQEPRSHHSAEEMAKLRSFIEGITAKMDKIFYEETNPRLKRLDDDLNDYVKYYQA